MVTVESRRTAAPPIVLATTLGLAAACWAAAVWLMRGMDMGVATRPGSFGFFAAVWVAMMAAMMLPGAAPAVARQARMGGTVRAALPFTGSYLAAGAVVIAAGAYELTPVKRHFRRRCREDARPGPRSGLGFGLCCAGSGIGLMAMFVALDVMSVFWMSVVAVLACAQKLLPAKAAIDVPLALALTGLGFVIVFAPSLVPGLTPPAM
jgi:predicted metal-binding membrane protein